MKPLPGGIKLDGKKEATLIPWTIYRPSPPKKVRIPLYVGAGLPRPGEETSPLLVRIGDRVLLGQKIAEGKGGAPALHASVSGTVSEIGNFPHALLEECETVEILSDGKDEVSPGMGKERTEWENLSSSEMTRTLQECGVLGIGAPHAPASTLILNACESEPYLTSDHALLMSHPVEILKGAEIVRRALGAKNVILAIEDNKEEVAEVLKSKIFFHTWSNVRVEVFPTRYPQENPLLLIRQLSEQGSAAVWDIAPVYAAYEAVVMQKPYYEKPVTIAGECVTQPKNVWVRVGTTVEEAVKYAKGFLRDPAKTILGGPMTGMAVATLEVPVLKETRAILGLPKEISKPEKVEPCIRCGRCIDSCPVSLSPAMITLAAEKDLFEVAEEYGASDCIECGNCSYVCPSKRPMVELIQYALALRARTATDTPAGVSSAALNAH